MAHLNDSDIRIDQYNEGPRGWMQYTHCPTGVSVTVSYGEDGDEKTMHRARQLARVRLLGLLIG